MSSGHYHRRWSSGTGGTGRTTPTSQNLPSTVEPSTYGTSWNSIRWNKPTAANHRSQSSSIAARFDGKPSYSISPATRAVSSTRYTNGNLSSAARTAAELASLGPSVSARASRFDASIKNVKDKYRSEARDLLTKWTSRERTGAENSYSTSRKPIENVAASGYLNKTSEFPYRKSSSMTPTRSSVPSVSRYSMERTGLLSPSPTPQSYTLKMERPWRQRMAEASRIRATHGDDVSASYMAARASRRNSLSQASGDELANSVGQLRSYVNHSSGYRSRQTSVDSSVYGPLSRFSTSYLPSHTKLREDRTSKYMSRSYSPIRSPVDVFKNASYSRVPTILQSKPLDSRLHDSGSGSPSFRRQSSQESIREERSIHTVSTVPKNPSIRESSRERDSEKLRKRSSRERTARRNSRQGSHNMGSSSSEDEADRSHTRAESKKRRRKKKIENADETASLPPPPSLAVTKSMQSSIYETGIEDTIKNSTTELRSGAATTAAVGNLRLNITESEDFQSCVGTPSPQASSMGGRLSHSNSRTKVQIPTKNQIIKSPSLIEVPGLHKSDSKSSLCIDLTNDLSETKGPAISPTKSNDFSDLDEFIDDEESATDASTALDDESQYSAVAHFKPFKPKVKRIAPVPGLWKKSGGEEFISKNKAFVREAQHSATFCVWTTKPKETIVRRCKVRSLVKDLPKKVEPRRVPSLKNTMEKKDILKPKESTMKLPALKRAGMKPSTVPAVKVEDKKKEESKKLAPIKKEDNLNSETKGKLITLTKNGDSKKENLATIKRTDEKKDEETLVTKGDEKKQGQKVDESSKSRKLFITKSKPKVVQDSKIRIEDRTGDTKEDAKATQKVEKKKSLSKPIVLKEEDTQVNATIKWKEQREKVFKTIVNSERVKATNSKKIREKKPLVTLSVDKILKKTLASKATRKTIEKKRKESSAASLSCRASSEHIITCCRDFDRKIAQGGAQVIVDTPTTDVNMSRLRWRVKMDRRSMPSFPELSQNDADVGFEFEKARLRVMPNGAEDLPRSQNQLRAAEVLDEMRDSEPLLEWRRRHSREEDYDNCGLLILPDKSILEEYVKRKRGKLERLHSEPILERDEGKSDCESPCNSTTSELLPACAVRVFQPSPRGVPVITAPSRNHSRMSSVESGTPTAMLDALPQTYNNFNSTPQGFLRNSSARIQIAKPIQFDAPKTPFEERLQQQANAIRKASVTSNLSEGEPQNRDPSPRRVSHPSEGMPSISSAFTAAVANSNQGRHERYAAHIPVNRGDNSGRQSAASQDSTQSGVLETASKQLDQVIDQARHRHHQHRSKFKEAIDYLDQIFEDLKKECDTNGEDKNNNKDDVSTTTAVINKPVSVQAENIRRATIFQPTANKSQSNSLPNRAQRHNKPIQPPSPVELVIPQPTSSHSPEVAVTETIVLPRKTDKLDFTRRWLQDDLSSLAHQPPAPIIMMPDMSFYTDIDEHSLGSCSAEVAAINSSNRKEKSKKTNGSSKPKSVEKPAPIRPQPFRPQPLYGVPGCSNGNGIRHFPIDLDAPKLPRVASFDHVPDRKMDVQNGNWRAGSQEPYQTLASVRSEDASRPSPSAFHNVSAFTTRGNMRGSLRSLPDAGLLVRSKYHQPTPPKDPTLAIDQLVAELELNTDQPVPAVDKRRSFPTSFGKVNSNYEHPIPRQGADLSQASVKERNAVNGHNFISQTTVSSYQQYSGNQHPVIPHVYSSSQSNAPLSSQQSKVSARQQKSLEEVTSMLNSVVNDFNTSQVIQQRKKHPSHILYATPHSTSQSNPFETINQEKINPSRVEAIHNMFERGAAPAQPAQTWRTQHPQPYKNTQKEEETYYEINEFSAKPYKRVSPPRQIYTSVVRRSPQQCFSQEYAPAFPLTQPPTHPPGRNGSANSSQNGGYYSSNSSGVGPAYHHNHPQIPVRRSSIVGRQSISSRAQSLEDDDDGFYDNVGVFDDRRFSRSSEMDVTSFSSRQLPPTGAKQNKIGSFFRKIGASRPPGSAASLISLNKVANETPIKSGALMKSNSLSTEPWKKHVLERQNVSNRESTTSKGSFGTRLKNSLFGSKKRLNG